MQASTSPHQLSRHRVAKTNPLYRLLKKVGLKPEDDICDTELAVFSFPTQCSTESCTHATAQQQAELVQLYHKHFCEHNISSNIQLTEEEWLPMANWVQANLTNIGHLKLTAKNDTVYQQAPVQAISADTYTEYTKKLQVALDFSTLSKFEWEK